MNLYFYPPLMKAMQISRVHETSREKTLCNMHAKEIVLRTNRLLLGQTGNDKLN